MTRKALLSALALAPTLAASTAAADILDSSTVSFQDLHFVAMNSGTVLSSKDKLGQKPLVIVSGGNTAVKISPANLAQNRDKLAFGIRHVDAGMHKFVFRYATDLGEASVGFQCNLMPGTGESVPSPEQAKKKYAKDMVDESGAVIPGTGESIPGTGESIPGTGESHDGSATVTAKFPGANTWSLKVKRKGQVLHDLSGLSGSFTIPNFEGKHEHSKTETLKVRLVYGAERPDAWSIVLRHEGHVVTITPDAAQAFDGLPALSLWTMGLDEVQLVDIKAG